MDKLKVSENRFKNFVDLATDGIYYLKIDPPMDLNLSPDEKLKYFFENAFFSELNDALLKINRIPDKESLLGQPVKTLVQSRARPG